MPDLAALKSAARAAIVMPAVFSFADKVIAAADFALRGLRILRDPRDMAALVGGASRVRRAAQSLAALGRMADDETRLERCGENLDLELHALQSWYVTLGYALVNNRPVPPPHIRDTEGTSRLLACVRDAARDRDKHTVHAALVLLWATQHLDNLWRLEAHLGERTNAARAAPLNAGALRNPGSSHHEKGRA